MKAPTQLLAAVFFASGFAGLVYQVGWQRILTIPLGVGAISTTLIVSVYMLGLGIGSLIGSKIADRTREPYRLYALIEALLGIAGFASVPILEILARLTAHLTPATAFLCSFLFLCFPTILMGITLPLLTAIFNRLTGNFISSISRLYFLNTLGAFAGALITGYVCVPLIGLDGSIYAASGLDCALSILILAARPAGTQSGGATADLCNSAHVLNATVILPYCLAFIAGFLAIGYEILWYRIIGILVKDSPYAFSTILAMYLLGIATGSAGIRHYLARHPKSDPKSIFYTIQFFIGVTVLLSFLGYYYMSGHGPLQWFTEWSFSADAHPSLDVLHGITVRNLYLLIDVFIWPIFFLLVPTALMGAGFPLVASAAFSSTKRAGSAAGLTYFFAIFGNALGGLATGFALLPWVGTEATFFAFSIVGLLFGILPDASGAHKARSRVRRAAASALILMVGLLFPRAGELYARMHKPPFEPVETIFAEGLDAVVLTYINGEYVRNFINGQGHGYRPGPIFYAEALEALSLAPSPAKVLVIGFGAGSAIEAALIADGVQQVTIVELCESVVRNLRQVPSLHGIFSNSKLRLVIDDGRRFLQRNQNRYDVILMDPLRTTTAYSNNVHSRQFFALARNRLSPDGILMVGGIPNGPIISRTLLEEFAHVRTYPDFSVASNRALGKNEARFEKLLESFKPEMRSWVREFRKGALEGDALRQAVSAWEPNDDWHPRSEYFLGAELQRLIGSSGQH